jgi:protein-L-isoaspartate(D-aspartate) O-methyltransferase
MSTSHPTTPLEEAQQRLVEQLIAFGDLWSRPLISAFRRTPRHRFLDRIYDHQKSNGCWRELSTASLGPTELALIYADRVLTTRLSEENGKGSGVAISSSSQPSLMARMLEDLQPKSGQRVLEVGTGTGYNAALLAHIAADVVSVDVDRRVVDEAQQHLASFLDRRVELHHTDGRAGYPDRAPYDRIMVTASTPDLEPAWLAQAEEGGLILAPVALAPGLAYVLCGQVNGGAFQGRLTRPAYFMPLRDESAETVEKERPERLPPHDRLTVVPAPWADWTDRKANSEVPTLPHALAFLAFLGGHVINYTTLSDGRPGYGLADPTQERVCWMGQRQWYVNGAVGRDLGLRLWRNFLEAGGPQPTEFQLDARPIGLVSDSYPLAPAASLLTYHRQGTYCHQTWSLLDPRLRYD